MNNINSKLLIGKKLRELRLKHGYTLKTVGGFFGKTAQAVARWENDINEPDLHVLLTLCVKYKIKDPRKEFGHVYKNLLGKD